MNMIKTGGYHIYATIDMDVQKLVDDVYQNLDRIPTTDSQQQLQSAIVVIDNATGDIVAMAGGVGEKEISLSWNRATPVHPPARLCHQAHFRLRPCHGSRGD